MMYLALTYDHRLLDGREAVTFLVKVRLIKYIQVSYLTLLTGEGVHRRPASHAFDLVECLCLPNSRCLYQKSSCLPVYPGGV